MRVLACLLLVLPVFGEDDPVAKLELAAPFTNNMILQRQSAVPVWGFDKPGSKITVAFAGQTKKSKSLKA